METKAALNDRWRGEGREAEVAEFRARIREECIDCSGGSIHEVKLCVIPECPLYPFRFGKNPFRKRRKLTDQQRQEIAERLRKSRAR
jgi:hypothetical protein